MKKIISLLLALSVVFMLCACSKSIEECTIEANRFISSTPYVEGYCVEGKFESDTNTFIVLVYGDRAVFENSYNQYGASMRESAIKASVAMQFDQNEEMISKVMDYLFDEVTAIYKNTDVEVFVTYMNVNGSLEHTISNID